jgi:geranylgeranyl reductase family protein
VPPTDTETSLSTPVCIVGAGPGGAATALRLSYLGIPCVLVDKATFPRDKVCGDAVSGKVITLLNRLDPGILQRFHGEPVHKSIWGVTFFAPNGKPVRLPFRMDYIGEEGPAPGYVSKRVDFDHFLIEEVRRREDIDVRLGVEIAYFDRTAEGWEVRDATGTFRVQCRLLIMANGANSAFSRKVAGLEKDARHHAGAVRAYYRGVTGMDRDNFIELHFLKGIIPGYFWIFPLPNKEANVGLGMRTDIIRRRGVNLRRLLEEIVEEHPLIRDRFRDAERLGKVQGYGLPLGSKTRLLSGDHYLLVGDAGHLIDPLTGEGIGNAFYSGFIAAELAEKVLAENDLSAERLRAYDGRVQRVLGSEMKLSYRLQNAGRNPFLLNIIANIITGNQRLMDYLSGIYTDFHLREQLAKPWFWVKMWWNKGGS